MPRLAIQTPARQADRAAYFGPDLGICTTPVVHRRDLGDVATAGPLIVEEYEGTTVVPPACHARLDANDNIVIELAA